RIVSSSAKFAGFKRLFEFSPRQGPAPPQALPPHERLRLRPPLPTRGTPCRCGFSRDPSCPRRTSWPMASRPCPAVEFTGVERPDLLLEQASVGRDQDRIGQHASGIAQPHPGVGG